MWSLSLLRHAEAFAQPRDTIMPPNNDDVDVIISACRVGFKDNWATDMGMPMDSTRDSVRLYCTVNFSYHRNSYIAIVTVSNCRAGCKDNGAMHMGMPMGITHSSPE